MQLFDLTKFYAKLENRQRWKKLCGLINQVQSAKSITTDLRLAASYVKAMRELDAETAVGKVRVDQGVLAGALFSAAVIAYARATTHSDNRKALAFERARKTHALKEAHRRIIALRNNAIAHFGPGGEHLPAPWVKQRLVAVLIGKRFALSLPQRLFLQQSELVNQLADLILPALEFAEASEDGLLQEMFAHLEELPDEALKAIMNDNFDPQVFFEGDADAMEGYRRNLVRTAESGRRTSRTAVHSKVRLNQDEV